MTAAPMPALSPLGKGAIALAGQGWQIFPITPGAKAPPLIKQWQKNATDDEDQIREWWSKWPDANIGVLCGDPEEGGSGIWAMDFDTDEAKGKKGMAVREQLIANHGAIGGLESITARGRQHLLVWDERCPIGPATDVGEIPGVDIRSNGSYIVAPPSLHPSGHRYAWGDGMPTRPEPWLLSWLQERLHQKPKPKPQPVAEGDPEPEPEPPEEPKGLRPYTEALAEELRSAMSSISGKNYDRWRDVGFAIYELGWGGNGFRLWDAWARNWPNHDAGGSEKAWESFGRSYKPEKITLNSIFHWAQEAGWTPPSAPVLFAPDATPQPFWETSSMFGPKITIDEVFGDAPSLASYLRAARDYLQVPESTLAMAHLTGISFAAAKRLAFDNGKFVQPPVLWLMSLLRTGARKSEIIDLVREPIIRVCSGRKAQEIRQEAEANLELLMQRQTEEEAKPEADRDKTRLAEIWVERKKWLARAVNLYDGVVSDTTEAALQGAMLTAGGAVMVCDGEAAALHNAIRPGWSDGGGGIPQTTTWLNAYSGKTIIVKRARKDRQQGKIDKPELAVCLLVQSGSPVAYLFDSDHLRDSGFVARFLIDCPQFDPSLIDVDVIRPGKGYNRPWVGLMEHLILRGIPTRPQVVHFDQHAAARFLDFRKVHQAEFRIGGANEDMPEFHNKAQGTLTRVAGCIATARAFEEHLGDGFVVTLSDVDRTINLFTKLVAHTRAAYGLDAPAVAAGPLARRMIQAAAKHWPRGTFSTRDVRAKGKLFKSAGSGAMRMAAELLVEAGWIIPTSERAWAQRADGRCRFKLAPGALDRVSTVPK